MPVRNPDPLPTAVALIAVLALPSGLLAADGDLDPTFWGDGKMNFSAVYDGDFTVADTLVAPDGAFVVVARRVPTSAPESMFWQRLGSSSLSTQCNFEPPGGATGVRRVVGTFDVAGRLLVGGTVDYGDERIAVARFLYPACTLDPTFDGDGYATFDLIPATAEWAEAIDSDALGRVYLAGWAGFPEIDVLVVRLDPAGSLDESFSGNGWLKFDSLGLAIDDAAYAVTVQADGRPVLAGVAEDGTGTVDALAIRLTETGQLDSSFAGDGVATVSFDLGTAGDQAHDFVWDVAFDADRGRLAIAGQTYATTTGPSYAAVAVLLPSGALDPAFAGDGKLAFQFENADNSAVTAVTFDGRGRLLACGPATVGAQNDFGIARLITTFFPGGVFDASFGGNGRVTVPFDLPGSTPDDLATSIALWSGRPLVGGTARHSDGNDRPAFVRLATSLIFADGFDTGTALAWPAWF